MELDAGNVVLSGRAPAGERIDILINGRVETGSVADADGNWTVVMPFTSPGSYAFAVQSVAANGLPGTQFGPAEITVAEDVAIMDIAAETEAVTVNTADLLDATAPATVVAETQSTHTERAQESGSGSLSSAATNRGSESDTIAVLPTVTPRTEPADTPTTTSTPMPRATQSATAAVSRKVSEANTTQPTLVPSRRTRARRVARATPPPAMQRPSRTQVGSVKLISPVDETGGSGRIVFTWESNFTPPPGTAYELIFWPRNRDPMVEGFGLSAPTLATVESVDLNALDHTLGNLLQPGEYRWGVLLVEVSPYRRIAFLGDEHEFRFNRTYGDGEPYVENPGE